MIIINDALEVRAPKPVDTRLVVGTDPYFGYAHKEDIPEWYRYPGLTVLVVDNDTDPNDNYTIYRLENGVTDNDWVRLDMSAGSGTNMVTVSYVHASLSDDISEVTFIDNNPDPKKSLTYFTEDNTILSVNGVRTLEYHLTYDYVNSHLILRTDFSIEKKDMVILTKI